MTLVDSSVWIEHLRRPDKDLIALMDATQVLLHPFVFGEVSLGQFPEREAVLQRLGVFEMAPLLPEKKVADLVRRFRLGGYRLG